MNEDGSSFHRLFDISPSSEQNDAGRHRERLVLFSQRLIITLSVMIHLLGRLASQAYRRKFLLRMRIEMRSDDRGENEREREKEEEISLQFSPSLSLSRS